MWVSEREKRKIRERFELENLKKEILKKDLESDLKKMKLNYQKEATTIVEIPFIDEKIFVEVPSFVFKRSGGKIVESSLKLVMLKYLINLSSLSCATQTDIVSFKELGVQTHDIVRSLVGGFAYDPGSFFRCGEEIGGHFSSHTSGSISFFVLPKIELLFRFKEGEENRSADVDVYISRNATFFLSSAELRYLAKIVVRKILKVAKRMFSEYSF